MSELIIPNRGTLIEGVRLPMWKNDAAEAVVKGMPKIVQLLPDTSKAGAFAMAVANEMNKLTQPCDDMSAINAACNCAALGLIPGGALAHAHFVAKKKNRNDRVADCQLWVGYRGYIQLAYQTGFLRDIYADVVYEGEPVETWTDDDGRHIKHDTIGRLDGDHDGKRIRCAYTVWSAVKGGRGVEIVPGKEIYDLQRKQGNVWNSNLAAMACKTPVRRAWRFWQVSGSNGERLAYAAHIDEQAERGERQDARYLPDGIDPERKPTRLLSDLGAPPESEPVADVTPEPSGERGTIPFVMLLAAAEAITDGNSPEADKLRDEINVEWSQGNITADEAQRLGSILAGAVPFG